MPHYFLDLPRELRDQIYSHVLSPTGLIALDHPRNTTQVRVSSYCHSRGFSPIDLAILRTCKQIGNECRGLIWKLNSFHWLSSTPLERRWWQMNKMYEVQSVSLALDFQNITYAGNHDLWRFLGRLHECALYGSLKELSLEIFLPKDFYRGLYLDPYRTSGKRWTIRMAMFQSIRRSLDDYLSLLEINKTLPESANVKRTAYVDFIRGGLNVKEGHRMEEGTIPPLPIDLLAKIHESFGGRLYHQGILCFKDGELATKLFQGTTNPSYRHEPFKLKMDCQKMHWEGIDCGCLMFQGCYTVVRLG
ncbi:hypothetical protein BDZ45DRAFT_27646 [Acephala macrosclerotiorum]|nr:hypothetical protein BDZ45DRAFT_27646 [Acephala macrosclerotiorum]